MQIDFGALERALAPIENIGKGEVTFDAGPTTITLRVILPNEEVEAQNYAATALNEGEEQEHSAVNYIDRLRIGFLSHSLVAIGDTDLRDVDFVETGETLPGGAAIKIPCYKAMRQLILRWSRTTLTGVFARFTELFHRSSAEAEKLIKFEPSSIPSEIDRLQKRIDELKAQLDQNKAIEQASVTNQVAALVTPPVPEPEPEADEDEVLVNPEQLMPAAARRTGPISPETAPPPPVRQPAPARVAAPSPPQQAASSFMDSDDDDSINSALDAEHNRIAEMRRRSAEGLQPVNDGSALQTIHPQLHQSVRRPPHLDAAAVEAEVGVLSPPVREVGKMDGRQVFALPEQEQDLGARASERVPGGAARLNPRQDGTSNRNPRFRSPKKP